MKKWLVLLAVLAVVAGSLAADGDAPKEADLPKDSPAEQASPEQADPNQAAEAALKTEEQSAEVEKKQEAEAQADSTPENEAVAEEKAEKKSEEEKLAEQKKLAEEEEKEEQAAPNTAENRPEPMEPASSWPGNKERPPASRPDYRCEICMMILLRKLERQDLCSSLQHEGDLETCRAAVETLTVYDRYVVDWLYGDGCQRKVGVTWKNIKPCPAHVVCSWMIHTFESGEKRTFCQFTDNTYRRSPAFHNKHHIPTKEYSIAEAADNGSTAPTL